VTDRDPLDPARPLPDWPKVTVCLPTYNRAAYLGACLDSLLSQTFQDFEVIVSDNCSPDATQEVVARRPDSRVRYIRNERNVGAFPNMNRCLAMARGDYVCVAHDDDLYEPRFLERQAAMLDRHPGVAFVHCATYEIDGEGRRRRVVRAYPEDRVVEGKAEFLRYLGGHNVCCSTVMARRILYAKLGGFDPGLLCSDWLMWLKLCLEGDVAYVAEPLACMRVHGASFSSSIDAARWCRDFLIILERGLALAEDACPSLVTNRPELLLRSVRSQGRRFFVAAVAAICEDDHRAADGFINVLRGLERQGLSRVYAGLAAALRNPVGRLCLQGVRRVRRLRAAQALAPRSAS
jgi:glycosyltransferase involved in cell wall biosynthesis